MPLELLTPGQRAEILKIRHCGGCGGGCHSHGHHKHDGHGHQHGKATATRAEVTDAAEVDAEVNGTPTRFSNFPDFSASACHSSHQSVNHP